MSKKVKLTKQERDARKLDGMRRAFKAFDAENKAGAMAKWILSDGGLRNAQVVRIKFMYENGAELDIDGREHKALIRLRNKLKGTKP